MKKVTLLATMALAATAANAQYTCNPETSEVLEQGKVTTVWAGILDGTSVNDFKAQGAEIIDCFENGTNINWYIWPDTGDSFVPGDGSYPGVGMHFDGYMSLNVGSIGWSGAGMSVGAPGVNTTAWNDETHVHMAYMSNGTVAPMIGMVFADGADMGSMPAKFSLGTSFENTPVIGPTSTDDWQGIDVTFATLKKLFPSFDYKAVTNWQGNFFSVLAGAVTGQNVSLDAVYMYNLGEGTGVDNLTAEAAWTVTAATINVNGSNGIELFNLAGQMVKSTEGCTLGLSNLNPGVYVARSGNTTRKVVVK
ncbi:MAG: T9SS type A sorting domain-containing protein [Muribaculaceae bacterium]|nr:T9SS type A sorting domain-containing protein [Muribaculaceae bacterium]